MYGAILGDIIGSPYEFDFHNIKTKEFPLFSKKSHFTDDTVMTIAVAEAVMDAGHLPIENFKRILTITMQRWGREYPHAGYGGRFRWWLKEENPKPYGSYGNGSAMRVSPVAWCCRHDFEKMREIARATAEVSHNHPEGIKGAESTACAIWMALNGFTKEEIKSFIEAEFGYDLSRTCDQIRPTYRHVETCQETVPEAMIAFLEGESFEDVIRTAVSLGGDSDTLTAIAGSIAEAYYRVEPEMIKKCKNMLSERLRSMTDIYDRHIKMMDQNT